jgi:hypothetical protein
MHILGLEIFTHTCAKGHVWDAMKTDTGITVAQVGGGAVLSSGPLCPFCVVEQLKTMFGPVKSVPKGSEPASGDASR